MPIRRCLASLALLLTALAACGGDDPTSSSPVVTDGLIALLTFSGNANDASGNGNHGTLLGGATAAGSLVLGDNITDMLSLPSSAMDGLGDFSLAAWLRIDTFRDEGHMVLSGANAIEDNHIGFFYREYADEWVFMADNDYFEFATDASIENGQWHHVVVTRSGTEARLYLNGSQLGSPISVLDDVLELDAGGLVIGQDQDTVAGGFESDEAWAGAMDNLRIYDRALTAAEALTLAQEPQS